MPFHLGLPDPPFGWYKPSEALVKKLAVVSLLALSALLAVFVVARAADRSRRINLPTAKA